MKIPVNTPEGQSEIEMPDNWLALESTQAQILDLMKKAFPKAAQDQEKQLKELIELTKKQNERQEKSDKDAEKDREKAQDLLDEIAKGSKDSGGSSGGKDESGLDPDAVARYNKAAAMGEKVFTKAYDAVVVMSTAAIGTASFIGGALYSSFMSVGDELNNLTNVGVGFSDGLSQGGMKATEALADLSLRGVDAAAVLGQFSNVAASLGKRTFVDLTEQFLDATQSGADLAMSLDKSVERYGNELSLRQQMGALNSQTRAGQVQQAKEIQTTIKRQQMYSKALGISSDQLAEFAANMITQAPVLSSTLLQFSSDVRGSVTSALQDFGSAMMGMGGQAGGDIASAMVDAASSGAMGFSEEMTGYVRAVPSLAGPMNEFITGVQNGTLTQEQSNQMAQQMAMNLGNLSQSEKNRIFALARAGDAQAQSMAKAVGQFEQSSKKLKDINAGLTMEGVQKGSNLLSSMMAELTGAFDAIKYSFMSGVGESEDLVEAFEVAKKTVMDALVGAFGGQVTEAGKTVKGLKERAADFGKILADKLPGIIQKVAVGLASFIKAIPSIIDGISTIGSVIGTAISIIGKLGKVLTVVIGALVAYKAITMTLTAIQKTRAAIAKMGGLLGGGGGGGGGGPDAPAIDAAGQSAERFTKTIAKGMKDISKGVKSLLTNVGEGIGKFIKSVSKGVASAVETLSKGIGKGLEAIGKGLGGFIKGMANGLTSLANPAALIGLAALVLAINGIALALRIAGPGLESFGEMIKSVLEGLAPVIESFGKAFKSVLEGIAAIIESVGKVINNYMTGIGYIIESVGYAIESVLDGVAAAVGSFGKAFLDVFIGIGFVVDSVGSAISDVITSIGGVFADVFNSIANVINSVGTAFKGVFDGIGDMMEKTFDSLGRLDGGQLFLAAGGIAAVGGALAALGAGKVIDGIGSFVSGLFGGGDPIQKLVDLGKVAPDINSLGETMGQFGDTVQGFNDAIAKLEATAFASDIALMCEALYSFQEAADSIDFGSILKLGAMQLFGNMGKKPEEPEKPAEPAPKLEEITVDAKPIPVARPVKTENIKPLVPEQVPAEVTANINKASKTEVQKTQIVNLDELDFGDAFAKARKAHGGAGGKFEWRGKEYQTNWKEEDYVKDPVPVDFGENLEKPIADRLKPLDMTGADESDFGNPEPVQPVTPNPEKLNKKPVTQIQPKGLEKPQEVTKPTPVETATPSGADNFTDENLPKPDTKASNSKKADGSFTDELLEKLLEETQKQNRLLRQQVQASNDIAKQI
jgi:hypothetical protein